jgi:Na+-transporting NADH:ubiquinone oxidoreductase subunit NqrC
MIVPKKTLGTLFVSLLVAGTSYGQLDRQHQQQRQQQQQQQRMQMPQQRQAPDIDVSDAEFAKFADAFQEVQSINGQAQEKMKGVIQENGMKTKRFTQIQKAKRNPQQSANVTPAEKKKMTKINGELKSVRKNAEKEMRAKIEEVGLTPKRYQEIMMAVRQDPEMQQKLKSMMSSEG